MSDSYDLTKLDPDAFEHLVNHLALKVLGAGHTGFGPGADGGRDGFFEGEAPYPSESERWSGKWYIQSKFHKPNLSTNPQKWLVQQVNKELEEFQKHDSKRRWPDNWIIATNVEPSGRPETGAFDQATKAVAKSRSKLAKRFQIWGGRKILDLLANYPEIAEYYAHFLTPGQLLTRFYQQIGDSQAQVGAILQHLVVTQLQEQQYTRLEQAGSTADARPGIHRLFTDLPFVCKDYDTKGMAAVYLAHATAQNLRVDDAIPDSPEWRSWRCHPSRARGWFIKGGPRQGKSTLAQYFCQIQRAALILERKGPRAKAAQKALAKEVQKCAIAAGLWPAVPRIPVLVELKVYAQWFGEQAQNDARGVLTHLAKRISAKVEQPVQVGTLKRAFGTGSWVFVFDGLDEVPSDVKDSVALEVLHFIDEVLVECNSDALNICTSRPQGYSGQFADLEAPVVELSTLSPEQALACAKPLFEIERTPEESKAYFQTLKSAIASRAVSEIMTTPLQAHIMAIVVRDGGKPPEQRWRLFNNFYQVIKKREANRNLPDRRLAKLLREGDVLLKALHNAIGFELHSRAETSHGAQTSLNRSELQKLVHDTVSNLQDTEIEETVNTLMEATTERLVLVSTPENTNEVRFDIRPLQEFFAAEFFYESVEAKVLGKRLQIVGADAHWREVMHFLLSALVATERQTELAVAVDALARLNEGLEEPDLRMFRRRMGGGSILAARLLQEGVLEHNKSHRQQFRKVLEPLFGSTDDHALRLLTDVVQPHSREWLEKVLVVALRESAECESIGAAMALARGLPAGEELVAATKSALLQASHRYKSCLFQRVSPDQLGNERATQLPHWFIEIPFRSLLDVDWRELGGNGVRAACAVLRTHPNQLKALIDNLQLPPNTTRLYRAVFETQELHLARRDREAHSENHGMISERLFRLEPFFSFSEWQPDVWQMLAQSTGIMQCVYLVFRLAQSRSRAALVALLDFVSDDMEILGSLPEEARSFLPFEPLRELGAPNQVRRRLADDARIAEAFGRSRLGFGRRFHVADLKDTKKHDWEATVNDLPEIALRLFERRFFFERGNKGGYLDQPESAYILARKLLEDPAPLLTSPGSWGRFIGLCPDLAENFRAVILELCAASEPVGAPLGTFQPFRIRLPSEAPLLPHVLNRLAAEFSSYLDQDWEMLNARMRDPDSLATKTAKCCDAKELFELVQREDSSAALRAAAAMMLLLHPDGDLFDRELCRERLVQCYHSGIGGWYLRGVGVCLQASLAANDLHSCSTMERLLQKASTDYEGRMALDPLLEASRQTSTAPFQRSKASGAWE